MPSPTPDADRPDLAETLRLAMVSGVGPRLREALLERFGSSEAVFAASKSELQGTPGIGAKLAEKIAAAREEVDIPALLALANRHRIGIVTQADAAYPRLLKEIHDPPAVLFMRGQFTPHDALSIAIVGTRHASAYGLKQAEALAGSLARAGLTIVSGLARGIDAAAHRGALAAGGRTIAVLASGLLNIYPPEHDKLAEQIAGKGALVSEAHPLAEPISGMFPQRNRVISGLSLGTIVVEAALRSGALITARHACEQGREVFAVPGRIDNRLARGCHRLIRDGVKLIESADDVLEELGPLVEATPRADGGPAIRHPAELSLNEVELQVLAEIHDEPILIDDVAAGCGLPMQRVLSTVSILEMRRILRRVGGNRIVRL